LNLLNKILFKIKKKIIDLLYKLKINFIFYKCYWVTNKNFSNNRKKIKFKNYLSIRVHPGAGIGHQLSNYNSALWFAKKFQLNHCHNKFPNKLWENLLNFSKNSVNTLDIIKKNYKIVQLPRFNEFDTNHLNIIKKIINYYSNQKILFMLEYDQSFKSQFQIANILKFKFFNKRNLLKDKIIFSKNYFNIAVHYRSGDILKNENLMSQRMLSNDYYLKSIKKALTLKPKNKKSIVYIFSQGHNLKKLLKKHNIRFQDCSRFNQFSTFLHFIYSDLLITSKSSFSYKAALISNNFKISPKNFWHKYPIDKKWKVL